MALFYGSTFLVYPDEKNMAAPSREARLSNGLISSVLETQGPQKKGNLWKTGSG